MDSDWNNRITCSSGMVANSGCDEVSGMTMCSSNWDLFVSLNQSFGPEFAAPHSDVFAHFSSNLALMASTNVAPQQQRENPEARTPSGTRKRKNYEDMQHKALEDEKRQKIEQNGGDKQGDFEENYVHVRAKRGQATNSHSLAERVRRERISERMRLLQELVPGCNKITGKAMMLDEIINYVQSLQRQVEFLSMKLATVNPEVNLDVDRVLSKDILRFPGSDTTMPVIASGLHSVPGYPINGMPGGIPSVLPLSRHTWNDELHGPVHASFIPDPFVCSLVSNDNCPDLPGMPKTEL